VHKFYPFLVIIAALLAAPVEACFLLSVSKVDNGRTSYSALEKWDAQVEDSRERYLSRKKFKKALLALEPASTEEYALHLARVVVPFEKVLKYERSNQPDSCGQFTNIEISGWVLENEVPTLEPISYELLRQSVYSGYNPKWRAQTLSNFLGKKCASEIQAEFRKSLLAKFAHKELKNIWWKLAPLTSDYLEPVDSKRISGLGSMYSYPRIEPVSVPLENSSAFQEKTLNDQLALRWREQNTLIWKSILSRGALPSQLCPAAWAALKEHAAARDARILLRYEENKKNAAKQSPNDKK
jgi:hypothetical protein